MLVPRLLHSGWTVRAVDADPAAGAPQLPVPAVVPGCVHTDLLAAGYIADPYLDDNEIRLGWIGRTAWLYETTFDAGRAADRVDLVADGLDTVATLTLNDVVLGRTANMHRGYRFDVTTILRPTGNRLTVRFDSAYRYAERLRDQLGARPGAYGEPFQFIRKIASNFGWDWGPTLVTDGIWQPIRLESWSVARLAEVRPIITVDGATGRVHAHVRLDRAAADVPLTLRMCVAEQSTTVPVPAGATSAVVTAEVAHPRRWFPRGYGEPHRYELTLALADDTGTTVDNWDRRIGFRSIHLDTSSDYAGTRFVVHVNGVPVFVRGANWIPDDAFATRVDRARYRERIGQAVDAGVNYLRVWGGGRYESDDFYDLADELGVLVGQDFLFACAAYPEEEPLRSEVDAEARYQVTRLAPHPSLAVWVGSNENLWGWHDWGWQEALQGRTWGRGYYLDLLPAIVAELDPTRPYWPSSPYSGTEDIHPNDPAHGTTHIWDVWNTHDYRHYATYRPRFVAEFGFQAPPTFPTLRRTISDEPLTPDSPGLLHHQKAADGNGKLARGLDGHFPPPKSFDDWHWATQLNQARAIAFGIAHFRSLRPRCAGTILWQLNDNWPVTSWSAIDGDGRRKPLWYALRRVYADRFLTIQPRDGAPALVAVNDSPRAWRAQLAARRLAFTGEPKAKTTLAIEVPAGGATTVSLPPDLTTPDDTAAELLVIDGDRQRALWFFAEDVDLAYPVADLDVDVKPVSGGFAVTVTARTLIRDLTLFPDRLDPAAAVDEQLVTLLPGESTVFQVSTDRPLAPGALTVTPVLRSANDLVVR